MIHILEFFYIHCILKMCFKNTLVQGWGGGFGQSVFLSTGVGGGFRNGHFGAYVLYGWPLNIFNAHDLSSGGQPLASECATTCER